MDPSLEPQKEGRINICGVPFWAPFWPQAGQEPLSASFFRLLRLPRALQEPLKRYSGAFSVEASIRTPVLDPVLVSKRDLGTLQIIEILLDKTIVFKEIVFLSWSRFWTSFWPHFGLPFRRLLASKMAENCLEIPLGAPKSRSPILFFGFKRRKRGFQKGDQKWTPNRNPGAIGFSGMCGAPGRTIGGV